jgi:ubiquinone/menaquinone biosynthesis C-methylase UbiE
MADSMEVLQKKHFDLIAEEYSSRIHEASYRYYLDFTKDALFKAIKSNHKKLSALRGLDIGCGIGDFTSAVAVLVKNMVGTDLSPGMISVARKRHSKRIRFITSKSDKIQFSDSTFDFCMAVHLFHHLAKEQLIEKTIKEMKRVTKIGGTIVVVDVNKKNPVSRLIQYLMVKRGVDTGKERLVNPKVVEKMFERNNIKLQYHKGVCLAPHFLPWLKIFNKTLEGSFIGKRFGKDYILVGEVHK